MTLTRFAPSPTGLLHTGHAYAAMVARDFARETSGRFLLRFEDIDSTRVREEYYAAIEEDLRWLGIQWDDVPLRQSNRLNSYNEALAQLKDAGMVYPCFCTRREIEEEIARMARAPHGPEGPLYPGTCRGLSDEERDQRIYSGRIPTWRLDSAKADRRIGPLSFIDAIHGSIDVDPHMLGDVVLARKDIGTSYHLAVVVDDAFQAITHVTRGEDLLPSTQIHRLLQVLLGFPEPLYMHHPLISDESGRRLAKRDKPRSIRHLRESGTTHEEILSSLPPLTLPPLTLPPDTPASG